MAPVSESAHPWSKCHTSVIRRSLLKRPSTLRGLIGTTRATPSPRFGRSSGVNEATIAHGSKRRHNRAERHTRRTKDSSPHVTGRARAVSPRLGCRSRVCGTHVAFPTRVPLAAAGMRFTRDSPSPVTIAFATSTLQRIRFTSQLLRRSARRVRRASFNWTRPSLVKFARLSSLPEFWLQEISPYYYG